MTMQIVDFRGMKYTLAKMIKTYHEKKVEEKKTSGKTGRLYQQRFGKKAKRGNTNGW